MIFGIPGHSELFYWPKKNQKPKFAFWSFLVQVFVSNSVWLLHHGETNCNHYSSKSFHATMLIFGILVQFEVFYWPKKNQNEKIDFGLFSKQKSGSSRTENETDFQRSWGIRGGWRAVGNQESLETTPFRMHSILRNEKLQWISRNCTFQGLVYNKIGQLVAVAEL